MDELTESYIEIHGLNITGDILPFTNAKNVTVSTKGVVSRTFDVVTTQWYFNGGSLPTDVSVGSLVKLHTTLQQDLGIQHSNLTHGGVYEVFLLVHHYTYIVNQLSCPSSYYSFIYSAIGYSYVVLDSAEIHLKYFGKYTCTHHAL